jgi:hypothetical protein
MSLYRTLRWVLTAALAALPAAAEDDVVRVEPSPVTVSGVVDRQTVSLTGTMRLVADKPVAKLRFLSDALAGPVALPLGSVKATSAPASLAAGEAADVGLTVSGLRQPGEYKGTLQIWDGAIRLATIEVQVRAAERPDLEVLDAPVSIQVVHPILPTDDPLARWLFHPRAASDRLPIRVENKGRAPVRITAADLVGLRPEIGLAGPEHQALHLEGTTPTVAPAGASEVTVAVDRGALPPDRYRGRLRVAAENLDTPSVTDFVLAVKHGPTLALVAILLGIVLGRTSRALETPLARKQLALLPRWVSLDEAVTALPDGALKTHLKELLAAARDQIEDPDVPEATAKATLDTIKAELRAGMKAAAGGAEPPTTPERSWLPSLIPGWLAGSPVLSAYGRVYVLRPFIFMLTLLFLLWTGFKTLYIGGSPSFGAHLFDDYVGLVIWGLGADVALRAIQNVPRR